MCYLVFTLIGFLITWLFNADVDAQGGLRYRRLGSDDLRRRGRDIFRRRGKQHKRTIGFGVIAVVFIYTTVANVIERPKASGSQDSFIGIIVISLLSRIRRSFELHATHVHLDRQALEFVSECSTDPWAIISHEPLRITAEAYRNKLDSAIEVSHLPLDQRRCFWK